MIDHDTVESTWQAIAAYPPSRAARELASIAERQPDLMAFVVAQAESLSSDASELAVFLFFNVFKMFEKSVDTRIRRVPEKLISRKADEMLDFLSRLEKADERFFERIAAVRASKQPHLTRYILEALIEEPDEDDDIELAEDETGALFTLLLTVVDALDEHLSREPS